MCRKNSSFYWVGALSLVNSLILLSGGDTFFVIGLGFTLIIDVAATMIGKEASDVARIAMIIAFSLDVIVALIVVGFGWLSGKRYRVAFAVGMALYVLVGLLFVLVQSWMSVGFHAFALVNMWSGFRAFGELAAFEKAIITTSDNDPQVENV